MKKTLLSLAIALAVATPGFVMAHPGGLDNYGGHTDKSTGKYHFHKDKAGNSLAEPREGVDPDANGGKKEMKEEKAPKAEKKAKKAAKAEKVEKAEKKAPKAEAKEEKAPKAEKKAKKAKKAAKK